MLLEKLLGNASSAKILLYLYHNGKAPLSYFTHAFGGALSPYQNALKKLLGAGILNEEKKKVRPLYKLNEGYPLYRELCELLQSATTHLPQKEQEKLLRQPYTTLAKQQEALATLEAVWRFLSRCETLSFSVVPLIGKTRLGKANVQVKKEEETLHFHEHGKWKEEQIPFSNAFIWTRFEERIELHKGCGQKLFSLYPSSVNLLTTKGGICLGSLKLTPLALHMQIKILKKGHTETYHYLYT